MESLINELYDYQSLFVVQNTKLLTKYLLYAK